MKINVVGGGPAGLFFALLMKAQDPSHEICVIEKNPRDVTWGWGVVFSRKTLGNLAAADPVFWEKLQQRLILWNDVVMLYQKQEVRVHGNPFSAIARIEILKTLQERCDELGVEMRFGETISDLARLRDADLLVGADGISSTVRETFADEFSPTIRYGKNRFIWLGTQRLFDGLTLGFVESPHGVFACHAYRFSDTTSTFIAECTEETWAAAGLQDAAIDQSLRHLESVFADELQGHSLLSNESSWIRFREVRNQHCSFENIVLLGDALHTAHFSIGSGTKLAMEDAISLTEQLRANDDLQSALRGFGEDRQPPVEKLQTAAAESQQWFEEMDDKMGPDPYLFSYDCMTRSGRVDLELLREQDPRFVTEYEKALAKG